MMTKKSPAAPSVDAAQAQDLFGPKSEIAVKLRQFYTAIQEETIPERFLALLEKLDAAEAASKETSDEK